MYRDQGGSQRSEPVVYCPDIPDSTDAERFSLKRLQKRHKDLTKALAGLTDLKQIVEGARLNAPCCTNREAYKCACLRGGNAGYMHIKAADLLLLRLDMVLQSIKNHGY